MLSKALAGLGYAVRPLLGTDPTVTDVPVGPSVTVVSVPARLLGAEPGREP